ncbi:cytochrome b [Thalassococcus lentus]|uniref:Cytochrome b/b6 domain-containing protein n=1 Tax=Thalassococcus lentus TaxID=1210524 RepID=A0ABT4XV46_9RHOB|nr:cytochrome b/b6 domain-containing protein [Thalassococcus lentus]MDA7425772.1 cytochrome b/b6 domain-containing protein [Thalassococcus lentus]
MTQRYENRQIALHWIIVVLIALQFVLHDPISEAFDEVVDGAAPAFSPFVGLHIFVGFCVFALMLVRLNLRMSLGAPPAPDAEPPLFQKLAKIAHWAFYALVICMPVSGAVAWFRASESAADAHEVMKFLLLALIAAHVGGVVVHQFVWKTNLIQRMLLKR